MDFLSRAGGRHCFILARDKNKKDQKNLRRKLVDYCPEQGDQKQAALKHKNKQSGSKCTAHFKMPLFFTRNNVFDTHDSAYEIITSI